MAKVIKWFQVEFKKVGSSQSAFVRYEASDSTDETLKKYGEASVPILPDPSGIIDTSGVFSDQIDAVEQFVNKKENII